MGNREQIAVAIGSVFVSMLPIPILFGIIALFEEGLGAAIVSLFSSLFWISMVSILVSVFIGTPIYLLLRYCKLNNWITVVLVGGAIGALVGNWLFPYSSTLVVCGVFGLFGAYASAAYKFGAEHIR